MSKPASILSTERIKLIAASILFGAAVVLICMLFLSYISVKLCFSADYFPALAHICQCAGCFASATVAARLRKSGAAACGLISFAAYAMVSVLLCLLVSGSFGVSFFLRILLLFASGCAGGFFGLHRAEKKMHKRHGRQAGKGTGGDR